MSKELEYPKDDNLAERVVCGLETDEVTGPLVAGFEAILSEDIRKELERNDIEVIKRPPTEDEKAALHSRRSHVVGMERALKAAGIGPNTGCPCGSERKFKKCCKPLLNDPTVDLDFIAKRLHLRSQDEFMPDEVRSILATGDF